MTDKQPESLRLAGLLELAPEEGVEPQTTEDASAELRRLHARIAELEAQLESIGAGGLSGPLMGCASIAASAGSEPVAHLWQHSETGRTRVVMPDAVVDASASWLLVGPLYLHPSPPEGMVGGWISVDERLPESDVPVLAHNGKWTGVAAWMSGDYLEPLERWQDEHREFIEMMGPAVTHWMPLPPPPTTPAGSGKGD